MEYIITVKELKENFHFWINYYPFSRLHFRTIDVPIYNQIFSIEELNNFNDDETIIMWSMKHNRELDKRIKELESNNS